MTKHRNIAKKRKKQLLAAVVVVAVVFLILLIGFLIYHYFFSKNANGYLIGNKYYGFELKTPKNWVARENTAYSEENITQILAQCKNDKLDSEIGDFRFESQKYPEAFGDPGYSSAGLTTGAILEITVNCISDNAKSNSGALIVAGEKASEEVLNSPEFGKTKLISFLHNNLQYKINEYVYISPADANNQNKLKQSYTEVFDKIISSFKFTK